MKRDKKGWKEKVISKLNREKEMKKDHCLSKFSKMKYAL